MSEKFSNKLAQFKHTALYGISDSLSKISPTYNKINDRFITGHYAAKGNILLSSIALVACDTLSKTPIVPAKTVDNKYTGTLVEQGVDPNFEAKTEAICDAVDPNSTPVETFVVNVKPVNGPTVSTVEFADCYTANGPVLTYNSNGEAMTTKYAQGVAGANNTIYDNLSGKPIFDYDAKVAEDGTTTITYRQPDITVNVQNDPTYKNDAIQIIVGGDNGDGNESKPFFVFARQDVPILATPTNEATATLEPTATATEAPVEKIHMTFEDWKKFLDQPYQGFRITNTNAVLEKKFSTYVLTSPKDVAILDQIDKEIPLVVLDSDGVVQVFENRDLVKSALLDGATVLVSSDSRSPSAIVHVLTDAANMAYLKGDVKSNGDAKITINFNTQTDRQDTNKKPFSLSYKLLNEEDSDLLVVTDANGKRFTPIIPSAPPHMSLFGTPQNGLASASIQNISSVEKYWIENVLSLGTYRYLNITSF